MVNTLYQKNYKVVYKEGDVSLQRSTFEYVPSLDDLLYIIKQDDTLNSIAYKFYKTSQYWFIIADTNKILNPFDLEVGKSLIIPKLSLL